MHASSAAGTARAEQATLRKLVLEATSLVSTCLRTVASLIGRAVLHERFLTGHLMQHAVGALANLAQLEQVCVCVYVCMCMCACVCVCVCEASLRTRRLILRVMQLRPAFIEPFPSSTSPSAALGALPASASARAVPMCKALLDLCRLPVPQVTPDCSLPCLAAVRT